MNNEEITLDWLLPLEDDEQFVGGVNKKLKDLNENNPIGGLGVNYETDPLDLNEEETK